MQATVAVAVRAANLSFDRPYTYLLPEGSAPVAPGRMVMVPFGRNDRPVQGIVLGDGGEPDAGTKTVCELPDDLPGLDADALRLALWMRSRYFCTCFDAVRLMIPAGEAMREETVYSVEREPRELSGLKNEIAAYIAASGGQAELSELKAAFPTQELLKTLAALVRQGDIKARSRQVRVMRGKTVRYARLTDEPVGRLSSRGEEICRYLRAEGEAALKDIEYYTSASAASLKTLEKNGIIEIFEKKAEPQLRPHAFDGELLPDPELSPEQEAAFRGLLEKALSGKPAAALLYGITGSGKTLVYIKLVRELERRGKTAIVLVPEISLTPQLMDRFYRYFGNSVAMLHSGLSASERTSEWKRIRSGEAGVVIGTRSAVFAPAKNLGAIIIDEEQEYTYRSENAPCYHARDVAKFRAVCSGGLLVLGSATPSLETMYAAKSGKYFLYTIKERYAGVRLPEVMFADMAAELRRGNSGVISSLLAGELKANLSRGEQSILFLNRRGRNRMVRCAVCGRAVECPNCSVSMTYHSANSRLMCHYCGHSEKVPGVCPSCGGMLLLEGAGTQKAAEEVAALLPGAELLRMDADTTGGKTSHEELLERFRAGNVPVLIGTQMVAKGLDFENVTLVGVLDADGELYTSDFRASERTFSQITQVVGRAGRGEKPGRAVIQTFSPENRVLLAAAKQDYEAFYADEIEFRRRMDYPPFSDILCLRLSGEKEGALNAAALRVKNFLEAALTGVIIGPAPAPVYRVSNRYRLRIFVRTRDSKSVREAVYNILAAFRGDGKNREISLTAEMNPLE